jgi:hypothetical protein
MPVTLTPIAYLMRGGPEHFSASNKDQYTISGVITVVDDTAFITGVSGKGKVAEIREGLEQIKMELGVQHVVWKRANGKEVSI